MPPMLSAASDKDVDADAVTPMPPLMPPLPATLMSPQLR